MKCIISIVYCFDIFLNYFLFVEGDENIFFFLKIWQLFVECVEIYRLNWVVLVVYIKYYNFKGEKLLKLYCIYIIIFEK